ncbi:rod shape-determining protein MreD [Anaerococcus provencensis]|uniref:rod shape-determining protein MreD n=1 Tax=Anaerococcus provencensis TaxID=938293 RepID=UPI0002F4051B|nr:rod shape-determining protein MreD [Anaerococcus provencensis]
MNKFKTFLILLISFILQTTIFSKINIFGANINIIIPAIVAISQILGYKVGGFGALIIGLVEDFLFTSFIGVRALSYFLIGSFVASDVISKDKPSGTISTFFASIFNFFLINLIYYIFTSKTTLATYLPIPLLVEALLNSLIYLIYINLVKKVMYVPTYRM